MTEKTWTKTLHNRWESGGVVLETFNLAEDVFKVPVGSTLTVAFREDQPAKSLWSRSEIEAYAESFPVGSDMRQAFQKILNMPEAE